MAYDKYQEYLTACSEIATQEHTVAIASLSCAKTELASLTTRIQQVIDRVGDFGPASQDAKDKLITVGKRVTTMASQELNSIHASLNRKKKLLSKFTVTLFGRTMTGKSTIREAITLGDGSTIGKGGQRTTKDIREYVWNHLRILDTPGIGAYKGSEDKEIALAVVDESDLILFLVSTDSIQRESFEAMKALRNHNKAIIFVLNVKRDLTKPIYLRQFLRNPEKLFAKDQLGGHFRRIRKLAGDELGMRYIKIVPIHALAAFLASRPEHCRVSQFLEANSRIDDLLKVIEREVKTNGRVRRLQTLLDATASYLMDLCEGLRSQAEEIRKSADYLKTKFDSLTTLLDSFVNNTRGRIERETRGKLDKLKRQVSSFVDDNIEKRDVDKRWKSLVQEQQIEKWAKDLQKSVVDELMGMLMDFNKEIERETELLEVLKIDGPECYDPHDVKRSLRWVSAGSSALASVAAVAIWIGGSNVWNPIGWVAGVVAVVSLFLSWLFSDRESKTRGQVWF